MSSNNSVGTLVSRGTNIVGDVYTPGNLKIEGSVEGKVEVGGELILINQGKITGEIHAGSAIIGGEITGNLFTNGKTILAGGSVLAGDLVTKTLVIEDGARIRGNCIIEEEHGPRENSP